MFEGKYGGDVPDILEELESDNSRNFKEEVLKREYNNKTLKDVFYYAYNPFIQYGIKQIPEYRTQYGPGAATLANVLKRLNVLYDRKKTGYAAQGWLAHELEGLSDRDAEVLERIIQRDLKCGVSVKTINKVWPNLIPEFPNMLAQPMRDDTIDKIEYPAFVQEKLDGQRANIIVKNNVVTVRTRNGKEIPELSNFFSDEVLTGVKGIDCVLDGELLVVDDKENYLPRKKSNGILNKIQKGTAKDEEIFNVRAVIWDVINYDCFHDSKPDSTPYHKRFHSVKKVVERSGSDKLGFVESKEVESFYEAKKFFTKKVSEGKEGAILKNRNHEWKNARSNDQVKMKVEKEADLRVMAIEEGRGKYKGFLGNFILTSEDGNLEVSVGSGFSDEQREIYFDEAMVDKIVTVKYNEVIDRDDEDKKSLFLPIFVEVRDDKDVANTLKELEG